MKKGLLALATLAVPLASHAQDLDVSLTRTTSAGDASFTAVSTGNLPAVGSLALSASLGFVDDPLVVVAEGDDDRLASIVDLQSTLDLGVAFGVHPRFEIGAGVPVVLGQTGDLTSASSEVDGSGIGDAWLRARWRFLGDADGTSLGLSLQLGLPTSAGAELMGDSNASARPQLVAAWQGRGALVAANVGARLRGSE